MTPDQISTLSRLIDLATDSRPSVSPEVFMQVHWLPFVNSMPTADRRMAWQVYLKAQAKHVHAIAEHLQTLPPKSIRVLEPALTHFVSIMSSFRYLGEAKAKA